MYSVFVKLQGEYFLAFGTEIDKYSFFVLASGKFFLKLFSGIEKRGVYENIFMKNYVMPDG